MRRVLILSPSQQPSYFLLLPPPPPPISSGFNLNNKVSPSILLIVIILAIIFFISGLLHLLVRFLLRPSNRDPDEMDNVTALQGQLQQLFHLHDAGVDQSFIDTLPVFNYKAIVGVKLDPFDCAVCLCEFEAEDKLRLLPKCSHAFHMECIDTWLLSHSTCPLCRATLLGDYSTNYTNNPSPRVLVLESGSESSREIFNNVSRTNSVARVNSSPHFGDEDTKSGEIQEKEEEKVILCSGEKVVSVKLGKFQSVSERSNDSDSNAEARRCFSMGSFTYVMDENSSLQVPIRTPLKKKQSNKKKPLIPGHRLAMSECGCDSSRELFNGLDDAFKINQDIQNNSSCSCSSSKKESFSVSKIWLRGKKDDQGTVEEPSRRAFSFRFPVESKGKNGRRTISEINMRRWENEVGFDEETQSCNSLDSMQANPPSFARRTLLWLMGKPNKVVHSSFSGIG